MRSQGIGPGTTFNPFIPTSDQEKNFYSQFQYDIKQTNDENKDKYHLGDYCMSNIKSS